MIIHRSPSPIPIPAPLVIVCLCMMLTALGSCKRSPSKKVQEHAIKVLLQNAPESLDPRFAMSSYATTVSELVYASLIQIGKGLKPETLLAQGFEQKNETTYLIRLRPNLFFHDGSPLTALDVVYTFESLLDPKQSSPHREKLKYLKSIKPMNDTDVVFTLQHPYAPFLSDLASIGIVSRNQGLQNNGSGPFRLISWDRTTNQIILAPHGKWFEGAPQIEKLVFKVVKDPTTRLLELMNGDADLYVGSILPKQLEVLRARCPSISITVSPGLAYSYLAMNLRGPKATASHEAQRTLTALADVKVRQAIAHSINVDEIIEFKFLNLAERASGLLPRGHWAKDPSLGISAFDPSLAKKLLDEAGFEDRGVANGGRFRVAISTTTDRFRQSLAQIIATSLNNIGIQTTVRVQDWGSLFEDIKQGNFEMFSAKWLPVIEPDLLSWVFHSSNIPGEGKGGGNRGGYRNPTVDDLLTRARETSDVDLRRSLYMQVENTLAQNLPYVPLWFEHDVVIHSPRLFGFNPSPSGSLFGLRQAHART